MFEKTNGKNSAGPVRNLHSKLVRDFFRHKSNNMNEPCFMVGFVATQIRECAFDEFDYTLSNHREGIGPESGWRPTDRPRELECLGVVAHSTPEEYLPAVITVHEGTKLAPAPEAKMKIPLGYVSLGKKVVGGHYFCKSSFWGSRGDFLNRLYSAFQSAALSGRSFVEVRCEVRTPAADEFFRGLSERGYSDRLDVLTIWIENELTLPAAGSWTWNWENL